MIKVNTEDWQYRIEATDGDFNKWFEIWKMCQSGFSSNETYYKLEGKDANGDPLAGGEIMVDIDNLIDYMLSIFYTIQRRSIPYYYVHRTIEREEK